MPLAEDLVLLLLDDATARPVVPEATLDRLIAGAVLVELAQAQRIRIVDHGSGRERARLVVADGSPTGDSQCDSVLRRLVARSGRVRVESALDRLSEEAGNAALLHLSRQGLVREVTPRWLGLELPSRRWTLVERARPDALRAAARSALIDGAPAQPQLAAVIRLLLAVGELSTAVPHELSVSQQELARRGGALGTSGALDVICAILELDDDGPHGLPVSTIPSGR